MGHLIVLVDGMEYKISLVPLYNGMFAKGISEIGNLELTEEKENEYIGNSKKKFKI